MASLWSDAGDALMSLCALRSATMPSNDAEREDRTDLVGEGVHEPSWWCTASCGRWGTGVR